MMKLFETKAEMDEALNKFSNLLNNSGWQLFTDLIDVNIEIVTEQILDKPKSATENEIDRLRSNLKLMKEIRNTPKNMIEIFKQGGEEIRFDPYDEVSETINSAQKHE